MCIHKILAALAIQLLTVTSACVDFQPPLKHKDTLGDPLPAGAISRLGTTRLWHPSWALSVAFSPDDKIVATAGQGEIVYWDIATGKECGTRTDVHETIKSVDFSGDGKTVIAATWFENAAIFGDVATGKQLRTIGRMPHFRSILMHDARNEVRALAVMPDSNTLAWPFDDRRTFISPKDGMSYSRVDHQLEFRNIDNGKLLEKIEFGHWYGRIEFVAFSRDGNTFAWSGKDDHIYIWDRAKKKELCKLPGHKDGPMCAAFSPDGRFLVSGGFDHCVRVWEVSTGKIVHNWKHTKPIRGVHYLPDGSGIVSGCAERIRLWHTTTGQLIREFSTPGGFQAINLSHNGNYLAAVSENGALSLCEVRTGKRMHDYIGHRHGVDALAFVLNSRFLASTGKDGLLLWDWRKNKIHKQFDGGRRLAISSDGKTALTSDRSKPPQMWDLSSGKESPLLPETKTARTVGISADGKYVVFGDWRNVKDNKAVNTQALYELKNGRMVASSRSQEQGEYAFTAVSVFTPNSRTVLVGGQSRPLELFSVPEMKLVQTFPYQHVHAATFSPDGKTLVVSYQSIYVLDVNKGKLLRELGEFGDFKEAVVFSPNGKTLASAKENGEVLLWETATWRLRRTFNGHTGSVQTLAFSPSGQYLASGSEDNTILIWDVTSHPPGDNVIETNKLWAELGHEDAKKANVAICQLLANPKNAMKILSQHLKPVPSLKAKKIKALIAELDSSSFAKREKARQLLQRIGVQAERELQAALKRSDSLEMHLRVKKLLSSIDNKRHDIPTGDWLRQLRALEILEQLDRPDSRNLLLALSKGASINRLTCEASDALQRIEKR